MAHVHYRGLVVFDPALPVGAADVVALEGSLGVSLPAGYRSFLEACNGGELLYDLRVPDLPGGRVMHFTMHRLSQVQPGHYSLDEEFKTVQNCFWADTLPKPALPIATAGGGDTLYLDLSDEGAGRLVAFLFQRPAWTGLPTSQGLVPVAESFEAFLSRLRLDPRVGREAWESAQRGATPEGLRDVSAWLDEGLSNWRVLFGTQGLALDEEAASVRGALDSGELTRSAVDLARHCGSPVAALVLGNSTPTAQEDLEAWSRALAGWGGEVLHRAVIGLQQGFLALASDEGIPADELEGLELGLKQADEALLLGRVPPSEQAVEPFVQMALNLVEKTPLDPAAIRHAVASELIAWALGYADPVRERASTNP